MIDYKVSDWGQLKTSIVGKDEMDERCFPVIHSPKPRSFNFKIHIPIEVVFMDELYHRNVKFQIETVFDVYSENSFVSNSRISKEGIEALSEMAIIVYRKLSESIKHYDSSIDVESLLPIPSKDDLVMSFSLSGSYGMN